MGHFGGNICVWLALFAVAAVVGMMAKTRRRRSDPKFNPPSDRAELADDRDEKPSPKRARVRPSSVPDRTALKSGVIVNTTSLSNLDRPCQAIMDLVEGNDGVMVFNANTFPNVSGRHPFLRGNTFEIAGDIWDQIERALSVVNNIPAEFLNNEFVSKGVRKSLQSMRKQLVLAAIATFGYGNCSNSVFSTYPTLASFAQLPATHVDRQIYSNYMYPMLCYVNHFLIGEDGLDPLNIPDLMTTAILGVKKAWHDVRKSGCPIWSVEYFHTSTKRFTAAERPCAGHFLPYALLADLFDEKFASTIDEKMAANGITEHYLTIPQSTNLFAFRGEAWWNRNA